MKKIFNYLITFVILSFFTISTVHITTATSYTQSNLDQTKAFLSNVVGLDVTKYSIAPPTFKQNFSQSTQATIAPNDAVYNPSNQNGIDMETSSIYFEAESSTIDVMSFFCDGKLSAVNINPLDYNYNYFYANSPGTLI